MEGIIIKENTTHKAVKFSDRIDIIEKAVDYEDDEVLDMNHPDIFLYSIPLDQEGNLKSIFDEFEEGNYNGWI